MNSKLIDIGRDLQLTENDMREIRKAEERSRFWTIIAGAVVIVGSFVAGYLIGGSTSSGSYPYSASTTGALMAARSGKRRWLLGVVLAILAFFSFSIGAALSSPSSFGVVTYYGAFSKKI
ncbi:MAG: hypothetical protein KJ653_07505 [Candidatus Thermoplasmatota archaeon]|nr:hypothetical protein [Candidatus Thermoplasmatota archaeon]